MVGWCSMGTFNDPWSTHIVICSIWSTEHADWPKLDEKSSSGITNDHQTDNYKKCWSVKDACPNFPARCEYIAYFSIISKFSIFYLFWLLYKMILLGIRLPSRINADLRPAAPRRSWVRAQAQLRLRQTWPHLALLILENNEWLNQQGQVECWMGSLTFEK